MVERWSALDILVNNAAKLTPSCAVAAIDPADWQRPLAVNLTGAWLMARWSIPHMLAAGRGVVLNMASPLGHVDLPAKAAHCTSKAALIAPTRSIAVDYGANGIRAVSLPPSRLAAASYLHRVVIPTSALSRSE